MLERWLPEILRLLRLLLPRSVVSNVDLETSCFECTHATTIGVSSIVALIISSTVRASAVLAVFSLVVGHTVDVLGA
jgi:hypothetical protein